MAWSGSRRASWSPLRPILPFGQPGHAFQRQLRLDRRGWAVQAGGAVEGGDAADPPAYRGRLVALGGSVDVAPHGRDGRRQGIEAVPDAGQGR